MIVPIFPLPNVVLFPKTAIPLHIFEKRYRRMARETLAGDRRIAMVLLQEGWERDYAGNPSVHQVACLGEIESFERLKKGKYDIVLAGISRVRLVREIRHAPYRLAEVELIGENPYDDKAEGIIIRRNRLDALFTRYTELMTQSRLDPASYAHGSFERLVNMAAVTLSLPAEQKQLLLEMDDLTERCDALIPMLQMQLEALQLVRDFEHLKPAYPDNN